MDTYISRYLTREGVRWSVIHQGMPICNDKATRAEAEAAATQMKVKPQVLWDGNAGRYWPLDTFAD